MKGPMTTQTLRGLAGLAPFHWRGDKANFLEFNAAFDALMGGSQLSDADMLAFTAFVNTILFQPNPNQNLDRSLPAALRGGNPVAGRDVFLTVRRDSPGSFTCNACHKADPGPGNQPDHHRSPQPQPLKIPHLRNMYQRCCSTGMPDESIDGFGMDHDGHVSASGTSSRQRSSQLHAAAEDRPGGVTCCPSIPGRRRRSDTRSR